MTSHDNVTDIVEPRTHYTLEYWHSENYSGEHREWVENIKIPVGNKLVAEIQGEAADTIATLRKQLDDARSEALEEAAKACEGQRYTQAGVDASFRDGDGRLGDHNETCDELADVIRALKGKS